MELYDILQDQGETEIHKDTDDSKYYFNMIFYISCEMVVKHEKVVCGKTFSGLKIEHIDSTKDEYYQTAYDKFQNDVFGDKQTMSREEWQTAVMKSSDWIIKTKTIRDKLGYTGDDGKEKQVQKKEI